jgi:hypothetical protein
MPTVPMRTSGVAVLGQMTKNNHKINVPKPKAARALDVAKKHIAWSLSVAVAVAASAQAQTRDDYCGAVPRPGFDQLPNQARSGRYLNKTYGYSLTIPAGFTAYTDARGPERGVLIGLSVADHAYLSVDASYDAFYDITAAGVHQRDLNTITLHDRVLGDKAANESLAQVPGGRYVMQVQCRDQEGPTWHEEIIVLRNREVYRLDLHSTPARYAGDLRFLNAMLKSWHWEPLQ